jgi:hypothetical protein
MASEPHYLDSRKADWAKPEVMFIADMKGSGTASLENMEARNICKVVWTSTAVLTFHYLLQEKI